MLVTAGPGSGKTTVITYRIYYLIHSLGISPEQILVITFTKAAAKQMHERFISLSEHVTPGVTFATFHALFYSIVREENAFETIRVLKESEKKQIMSEILKREGIFFPQAEMIEEIIRQISFIRNQNIDLEKYQPLYFERSMFIKVYKSYEKQVKNLGKVDFDDMMLECKKLLSSHPLILDRWQKRFRFYLVDEFQDINPLQYDILMLLTKKEHNIFCVGDEDQAIYGFRGARPKLMFDFLKCYDNVEHLLMTRNYRSESMIVEASNKLIQKNKERFQKKVIATKKGTTENIKTVCFDDEVSQYETIANEINQYLQTGSAEEIAILFRTNQIPQEFIEVMHENQIKIKLKTEFLTLGDDEITKDIYAYLMLSRGELKSIYLRRIMNKPVRYLSKDLLDEETFSWEQLLVRAGSRQYCIDAIMQLRTQINFLGGLPLYAATLFIRKGIGYEQYLFDRFESKKQKTIERLNEIQNSVKNYETPMEWMEHLIDLKELQKKESNEDRNCVSLLTMHAAKGLEWQFVIIPDVVEGNYPFRRAKTKDEFEEERRIFYVGMTRAKRKLLLTAVNNPLTEKKPSVFFKELLL